MTLRKIQLALVLVLLTLPACGGGSTTGPAGPVYLNAPDDLIEGLRVAWESRDASKVSPLLSDDFEFFLPRNDVEFWGLTPSWGKSAEMQCSTAIFTGQAGLRPGQKYQPPVDNRFTFGLYMTPVEPDWQVTPRLDPPFAGLLARRYDVIMTAQYINTDLDFVGSRQEFFIEDKIVSENPETHQYFIRAWRDQGNPDPALRHGTISWGFFKSFFFE